MGADAITSGLEGAWTTEPTKWDNGFFDNLFGFEWELTTSPAGAKQWKPKDDAAATAVVDAYDPAKRHAPTMLTTDLALRFDPVYEPISRRFHEHPDQLADAFARAWYKLLHRDMGPVSRYLGPWVPEPQLWQDPVPAVDHALVDAPTSPRSSAPPRLRPLGVAAGQTAWASASSHRGTDKRGGANGARLRLSPQKDWEVNEPAELATALETLEQRAARLQRVRRRRQADLARRPHRPGGAAAVEEAASRAGTRSPCRSRRAAPTPPRSRPTSSPSPSWSRAPTASATGSAHGEPLSPETLLLERANLLTSPRRR